MYGVSLPGLTEIDTVGCDRLFAGLGGTGISYKRLIGRIRASRHVDGIAFTGFHLEIGIAGAAFRFEASEECAFATIPTNANSLSGYAFAVEILHENFDQT